MYDAGLDGLKFKGTTTVAFKCVDGVIMATDTRATVMPGFVAHKRVKKVYKITRNVGMTIAGIPAEAINLLDILRANALLYQIQRRRIIPVKVVASLASVMLFQQRYFPYEIQVIIGGYDDEGYRLFSLDPFGSAIEDNMIATGSGSPIAYGVLESGYHEGLTIQEGLPLAIKAIHAAIKRDAFTGDSFDVAVITREGGYIELTEEEKRRIFSGASS